MVFKKLMANLGFGGVEVDTILATPSLAPNGPLSGQIQLRAKGDTTITAVQLLVTATGPHGEMELARYPVTGGFALSAGQTHSIPFALALPPHTPVTVLYGQRLPGLNVGVRTEVAVASGSAKTDFDPAWVEATPLHQQVIDALGAIGCRFVRNELRPGAAVGLPSPLVQSITFYAPVAPGQPVGPHVPQLSFTFLPDQHGLAIIAGLAHLGGQGDHYRLTAADADQISAQPEGWLDLIDTWVTQALTKLSSAPMGGAGAFLQQPAAGYGRQTQHGYGQPAHRGGYGHSSHKHRPYHYGGHRGMGVGGAVAAGVGGAALGFFGGMVVGDMLDGAFQPDVIDAAQDFGGDIGGDIGAVQDFGGDIGAVQDFSGGFDGGGFDGGFDGGGFDGGGFDI